MEIRRIFDILNRTSESYPDNFALSSKKRGVWKTYTYKEYQQITDQISLGLISLGVKKNDTIASITNNRPEWNFIDMAIAQSGAIHVPLYPNYNLNDFMYILNNAEVNIIFTANRLLWDILNKIRPDLPFVKEIYCLDDQEDIPDLNTIIKSGSEITDNGILEDRKASVSSDDIASLYYTSGTTGYPKGAMVSHKNIVSLVTNMSEIYNINTGEKVISFLPLCHSFESAHNYIYQLSTAHIYYADSTASILENMKEVKPVMFLTVPLMLEKIVSIISDKSRFSKGIQKILFNWAYNIAMKYNIGHHLSLTYKSGLYLARLVVYLKWKRMMGGNIRIISAGGASQPEHFLKLFSAMGINILEVYGLTETYCVAANTTKFGIRFGTVGVPFTEVEVKISSDGEILCKSPYVIKGYYKQPELSAKVIDADGWFHTGDLGEFTEEKFLKIIGRKNITFKTSSGNYFAPENAEKKLKQNLFIKHIMLVGKDKNFLSALIVPDFEYITKWCNQQGISDTKPENLVKNDRIISEFQKEIDNYNKTSWETEIIKKFRLLTDDWSTATGELTPLMKMKRNVIEQKYLHIINEFYRVNRKK
jgi:long-chain acyl-CoA synthetase